MRYGAIYIAHNPRDGDSIFKVGKTERSVEERMSELTSATSNLGKYSAYASFVVFDVDSAEYACHKRLRRYRVQENREFFEISLPRLLKIVAEEIERYSARDYVPEIDVEETPDLEQKSAIEMLKLAREQRNDVDQSWDKALANATDVVIGWSAEIRKKVAAAADELSGEKTLRWEMADNIEENLDRPHYAAVCTVIVYSLFTKKPLELCRSGIQGEIYDDLDLSRAIGEPEFETTGVDEKSQFVKWKELDDGRIGRISLMPHLENAAPFNKERGNLPVPKLIVRATQIRYDDYHQNFEEKYHSDKSFTDPNEAVEVFLSIVIDNIKVPQHDVRKLSGTYRKSYGESREKIIDLGKFEIGLLRDEDDDLF